MNDLELIDEIVRRADEHQKQKEKEFAIAEIEKIKAELKDSVYLYRDFVFEVIDNRIAELKGENK